MKTADESAAQSDSRSLPASERLEAAYAKDDAATRASDTLLINEQSRLLEAEGKRVYKFGFGQSPFPVFSSAVDTLAAHAADKDYLPVQGLPALRAQVAAFHTDTDATPWEASRVVIGPGSKLLLFALMKALPEADILIPAPSWVSYAPQARMAGQRAVRLEASFETRWQITAAQLEAHCRAEPERLKVLIYNAPGNPTGLAPALEEQQRLAEVARHYGVLVLADEIYGLLNHRGTHRAFAHDYPEATVTTGGLSKWCGAGGWRLGVMHVPATLGSEVFARVLGIASETWSSVASPVQQAAITAYTRTDALDAYLQRQRNVLSEIGQWCAARLNEAGVRTHAPDGGFYLFPDFEAHRQALAARGITTSAELTRRLLEEAGVALLPGSAFGCDPGQLTVRLAYVDFDGAALLHSGGTVMDHEATLPVVEGIEAIVGWLQQQT
ncbi:aminotransferase class I/II-fold pyridoxal phosphate-dependent enzyme [Halomonas sp. McH1-25]|uniref:pyridoxal phosphate-dependent aminotransferase n=1 Tax=unclassified Halomonas TaxID=2609666 RepID=UPI001EF6757A|nr:MULTISPECIES: aminotransferase class I/II-fold pyridoxal phosphate-dependent enzyme [unclassified Halomonas]MCG7600604.1 aminotransferase class I/II-fold pyridoxal phosphate-dependent enzyme [Halomonas sp. McH1-25]MCP1343227.1 aminotransferase class I/II-fold pyridoxal phosphate-dependent enzyme [Halomonas sp. FL8]MCP1359923.1 aminotransferase class I/II-fold pyridoxal phosphate-dependent enzyme [Halomonas sp. BBD45]MCP1365650.1 aminotransferase class I/II-fold pyridoxal phosphate-dependent 